MLFNREILFLVIKYIIFCEVYELGWLVIVMYCLLVEVAYYFRVKFNIVMGFVLFISSVNKPNFNL